MGFIHGDLNTAMPVYVTRKTANGYTGSISLSIWMPLLATLLVVLNLIAWGVLGLVFALLTAWGLVF